MYYIYIYRLILTTFSVHWHDIPHQLRIPTVTNNEWMKAYTDLAQYGDLSKNQFQNMPLFLLSMLLNAKKYVETCFINNKTLEAVTDNGILLGPCGKIQVQGVLETPVDYTWTINVWKNLKINASVTTVDVPFSDDPQCSVNYLHLYNDLIEEDIARLCGRASGKIFYSNASSVNINLILEYAKPNTNKILSITYQAISKFRIDTVMLKPKVGSGDLFWNHDQSRSDALDYNAQELYVRADNFKMNVFYYNTYIWNRLKANVQSRNCAGARLSVYDGPNSQSKLLGDSESRAHDTYISSLSILSIYIMQQISISTLCYNINVSLTEHHIQRKWVYVSSTERIHYEAGHVNALEVINIKVPPDKFINIKMSRFVYSGNTEAGCYLGGIFIHDTGKPNFGPLCGENGRLIFEDNTLDGLTLSSNNADIYFFIFFGDNSKLSLNMIISVDECEGIVNPRNIYIGQEYIGKHIDYWQSWAEFSSGRLVLKLSPSMTCVKIQNFFDTNSPKSCFVMVTHKQKGETEKFVDTNQRYSAQLLVASKAPLDNTFWLTKPYSITIHKHDITWKDVHVPRLPTNESIVAESYDATFFSFAMVHEVHSAEKYDGVTRITIRNSKRQECSEKEVSVSDGFKSEHLHGIMCTGITVNISNAVCNIIYPWPTKNQMSITISRLSTKLCFDGEIFVLMKLTSNEDHEGSMKLDVALLWVLKYKTIRWTIYDIDFLDTVDIFVGVNASHIPLTPSDSLHFFNIPQSARNLSINTSCEHVIRVENKVQPFPTGQHQLFETKDSDETFCLFSTCYTSYTRMNASWNSADIFCQQRNQQIFIINSDIKAKFIEYIIFTDVDIYYSPVIFLNMQQDGQVCVTE